MEKKSLIEYVKACYELEKSVYMQEEAIDVLESKLDYWGNYQSRQRGFYNCHRLTIPDETEVYGRNPNYLRPYDRGNFTPCVAVFRSEDRGNEKPHSSEEVKIYITATRNLTFKFWQGYDKRKKIKLEAYNKALAEANSQIKTYNEKVMRESLENSKLIKKEIENEKNILNCTEEILDLFYEKDIIFQKYRSFAAISSILEYLVSGRCKSLAEAYNKYEEELRQNIIIDKLDIIIDKLDQIERNQYMLYDAIMSVGEKIDAFSDEIDKALSSISQLNKNATICAYNSEIIAENELYQSKLLTFDVTYGILNK